MQTSSLKISNLIREQILSIGDFLEILQWALSAVENENFLLLEKITKNSDTDWVKELWKDLEGDKKFEKTTFQGSFEKPNQTSAEADQKPIHKKNQEKVSINKLNLPSSLLFQKIQRILILEVYSSNFKNSLGDSYDKTKIMEQVSEYLGGRLEKVLEVDGLEFSVLESELGDKLKPNLIEKPNDTSLDSSSLISAVLSQKIDMKILESLKLDVFLKQLFEILNTSNINPKQTPKLEPSSPNQTQQRDLNNQEKVLKQGDKVQESDTKLTAKLATNSDLAKILDKLAKKNPKLNQYLIDSYRQNTLKTVRQKNIRPCSYYQIKQCGGICLGLESMAEYSERLTKIGQVLTGRTRPVEEFIHNQIQRSAAVENYELAAFWRDKIKILETLSEDQKIVLDKNLNLDILTFYLDAKIEGISDFESHESSLSGSSQPEYLELIENSNLDTCSVFVQSIRDGRMVNVNNYLMSGSFDGDEELENSFENDFEHGFENNLEQNLESAINQESGQNSELKSEYTSTQKSQNKSKKSKPHHSHFLVKRQDFGEVENEFLAKDFSLNTESADQNTKFESSYKIDHKLPTMELSLDDDFGSKNFDKTDIDNLLREKFEYFVRQFLVAYRSSATEVVPILIQTWY